MTQDFRQLEIKGYQVIPGVLKQEEVDLASTLFRKWMEANPQFDSKKQPHGVIKHYNIGQSAFSWYIRTRPSVIGAFKDFWGKDDLVVSFDGVGYWTNQEKRRNTWWLHTDQSPNRPGFKCVQGLVVIKGSENSGGLSLVPGSHLTHVELKAEHNKDWFKVEETPELKSKVIQVAANPGDLILWDSRVLHQNNYGEDCRLVQYVCYLPRSGLKQQEAYKRRKYYRDRRTTSHWPYPIRVNGLQPQTFGDNSRLIDYSKVSESELGSDWLTIHKEEIEKLI